MARMQSARPETRLGAGSSHADTWGHPYLHFEHSLKFIKT